MRTDGTKSYYAARHTGKTVASMHDHSDLVATSGMGEMIVVLNGVEFRTRHNDYKLKMPSTTSGDYHATEDITFPEVPPEVQPNMTIDEQVREREGERESRLSVCVRPACVRACVRARARVCVCVCVCARARARAWRG